MWCFQAFGDDFEVSPDSPEAHWGSRLRFQSLAQASSAIRVLLPLSGWDVHFPPAHSAGLDPNVQQHSYIVTTFVVCVKFRQGRETPEIPAE
jgi:hypothetical protein